MNDNGVWDINEALGEHSFSPRLALLLCDVFAKGARITDYGCGLGFYVAFLRTRGFSVTGIEGTKNVGTLAMVDDIIEHDLTRPPLASKERSNALCLEVGEHIPAIHLPTLLDNLMSSDPKKIVISWAIPGQGGRGHVNELDNLGVLDIFKSRHYSLNSKQTRMLRDGMKDDKCWWFKNTLFVFDADTPPV